MFTIIFILQLEIIRSGAEFKELSRRLKFC